MTPGNPKFRFLYLTWAFLECLGFGGLIYGWGSLVFILKDEGLYLDLCDIPDASNATIAPTMNVSINNIGYTVATGGNVSLVINGDPSTTTTIGPEEDPGNCEARNARLNLVFTIGSSMFCAGCFIMGQINFKFGTRVSRLVAMVVFIVGDLMLAFTSNDMEWLVFPGLSLIGAAGITYLMTNTQISVLFPAMGSAVVGLLCGGFDASSGIMLMVKFGYENGISRKTSFLILAGAHLLTLVSTLLFLPKDFIKKPATPNRRLDAIADEPETTVELTNGKSDKEKEEKDSSIPSIFSCLISPIYILHVMWLSVLQLRFYFLLGSLNAMMGKILPTKDDVSYFTNVLMYMMMCGLFAAPLAGFVYDFHNRFFINSRSSLRRTVMPAVIPLALTTVLSILMSGFVLAESAETLYAVFFLLLFFRAFLYTMGAGYLSAIFPSQYFGMLYGILIITAGIISMFQYALFQWAEASGFTQVNLFMLILVFVTFIHPLFQWWKCRRAEQTEEFTE